MEKDSGDASSPESPVLNIAHLLKQYDLIFLLKARHWRPDQSIYDVVTTRLIPEDFTLSPEQVKACIQKNQERVLFIIDGYDEAAGSAPEGFVKLLDRKMLTSCNLLVTSRPGFVKKRMKCFNLFFVNIGYDDIKQKEFIMKYSKEMTWDMAQVMALLGHLENNPALRELCKNPLNLTIVCMLFGEMNSSKEHEHMSYINNTVLYTQLFEFMLKRTCKRVAYEPEELQYFLSPLYRLAYEALGCENFAIPEAQLQKEFSEAELEVLPHLGFFKREQIIVRFDPTTNYLFTHKSFVEFFAAIYLTRLPYEQLETELHRIIGSRRYGSTLEFLFGVFNKDAVSLSEVIGVWINNSFNTLSAIPDYQLSVHDVTESHKLHQILHCLCELNLEENDVLIEELGPALCRLRHHLRPMAFVSAWCIWGCIEGYTKLCHACDVYLRDFCQDGAEDRSFVESESLSEVSQRKHHPLHFHSWTEIMMMGPCLEKTRLPVYEGLLQELVNTMYVQSVFIYNVTDFTQVIQALKLLQPGSVISHIKRLRIQFLGGTVEKKLRNTSIGSSFESLRLTDCPSPGIIREFLEAIPKTNNNFLELRLNHCSVDSSVCDIICSKLSSWSKLRYFALTGHALNVSDPMCIVHLLKSLSQLKTLEEVDISHLPSNSGQEIFPIESDAMGLMLPHFSDLLNNNQNLLSLWISYTVLDSPLISLLTAFLIGNNNLRTLGLTHSMVPKESHEAINSLFSSFRAVKNLRCLSLRATEVSHENLLTLGRVMPKMKKLELFSNAPTPLHRKEVGGITLGLSQVTSKLSEIHLRKISFANMEDAVTDFADALRQLKHLRVLKLGMHPGSYMTSAGLAELFSALADCTNLYQVHLRHMGLDDTHMEQLGEILIQNQAIKWLDLHHNRITGKGAGILNRHLSRRSRLMCLDISDCLLTEHDESVKQLRGVVCSLKVNWF